MSRTLSAIFIFVIFGLLEAQQPSPPAQPTPIGVHVSEGPGAAFQFTKVDNDVLVEADAVDAQYEEKGRVLHDPGLQAYIDAVGNRVLGGRPVPEKVTYRFLVLSNPMVNAFALANGSVYITTGLLALLENEAQLAGVLGCLAAHIYERHPYLENRSNRKKTAASEIIAAAATFVPGGYASWLAATVGLNVSDLLIVESIYGYSRELESQADRDGLAAMTAAGYDPHAMADAFELLDQNSTLEYEPHPTFYHDHPKLKKRQEEALAFADAHTAASARAALKMDYLKAVAPVIVSNIGSDLESRRPRTALARAARLVDAFPGVAQYRVLLGDSYRALGAKTAVPTPYELSAEGEAWQRNMVLKMTEQEEQAALLKISGGPATLKENQAEAEKAFLAAMESDPKYAPAYRELGFLYQDESRFADAALNYRHYLQLAADTSLDRLRITRRLAEVEKLKAAQPH
jgi:tetratricopeptide (TPR) repeat protein